MSGMLMNPSTLKGGVDATGHHAVDLDKRIRDISRSTAQPVRVVAPPTGNAATRRVRSAPLTSIAIAIGAGLAVGFFASRWRL